MPHSETELSEINKVKASLQTIKLEILILKRKTLLRKYSPDQP
jgi:hypothetical protein